METKAILLFLVIMIFAVGITCYNVSKNKKRKSGGPGGGSITEPSGDPTQEQSY